MIFLGSEWHGTEHSGRTEDGDAEVPHPILSSSGLASSMSGQQILRKNSDGSTPKV